MAHPRQVKAITQFVKGDGASWNNLAIPVPEGVFTIEWDTGVCKLGDGINYYPNLPVLFNFKDLPQIFTILAGKANIQHQHEISDIIGLEELINDIIGGEGGNIVTTNSIKSIAVAHRFVIFDNGSIATTTWKPNPANGQFITALINSPNVTLQKPDSETGMVYDLNILLTTATTGTRVNLDTTVKYLGGDGLILHPNQLYEYTLKVHNSKAYVTTTLLD